jgi:hypothetical protein
MLFSIFNSFLIFRFSMAAGPWTAVGGNDDDSANMGFRMLEEALLG